MSDKTIIDNVESIKLDLMFTQMHPIIWQHLNVLFTEIERLRAENEQLKSDLAAFLDEETTT